MGGLGGFAPQTLIAYFQNARRFFVKPFASLILPKIDFCVVHLGIFGG